MYEGYSLGENKTHFYLENLLNSYEFNHGSELMVSTTALWCGNLDSFCFEKSCECVSIR